VALIVLAVLVLALVVAEPSAGDRILRGPLIVTWRPEVTPKRRPRSKAVPATFRLAFKSKSLETAEIPQLSSFGVEILKPVVIDTTGLPPCSPHTIFSPDLGEEACAKGGSLVGHGGITFEAALPERPPSRGVRGVFRAFYSHDVIPSDGGEHPGIFAVVRVRLPAPTTLVMPFTLENGGPNGGKRLVMPPGRIPERLSHISAFNISLNRVYVDEKGKRSSLVSATCPRTPGFTDPGFPFLYGTLTYANGAELTVHDYPNCTIAH
jgi:hypothetical protein